MFKKLSTSIISFLLVANAHAGFADRVQNTQESYNGNTITDILENENVYRGKLLAYEFILAAVKTAQRIENTHLAGYSETSKMAIAIPGVIAAPLAAGAGIHQRKFLSAFLSPSVDMKAFKETAEMYQKEVLRKSAELRQVSGATQVTEQQAKVIAQRLKAFDAAKADLARHMSTKPSVPVRAYSRLKRFAKITIVAGAITAVAAVSGQSLVIILPENTEVLVESIEERMDILEELLLTIELERV